MRGIRKGIMLAEGKKSFSHQLPCCENPDEAAAEINSLLMSDSPCMIARYGATELLCMTNYLGIKNQSNFCRFVFGKSTEWWWTDIVKRNMCQWSGFFPATPENLKHFCELMEDDTRQLDLLGCWDQHESLFEEQLKGVKRVHLRLLEPFWSTIPWTHCLAGKKVLVVHPFAELIAEQYKFRMQIFPDGLLPDFHLEVFESVQSLGGHCRDYISWFEALDAMEKEIDSRDYDVCLIGCGAYGFPLAAHVKRTGKKAFHIGGALQLLFGIKGSRWENPNYGVAEWGIPVGSYTNLMNEYWKRPDKKVLPDNAQSVENACYW